MTKSLLNGIAELIVFDIESRGHRVYWTVNRAISIKRSVYYAMARGGTPVRTLF